MTEALGHRFLTLSMFSPHVLGAFSPVGDLHRARLVSSQAHGHGPSPSFAHILLNCLISTEDSSYRIWDYNNAYVRRLPLY